MSAGFGLLTSLLAHAQYLILMYSKQICSRRGIFPTSFAETKHPLPSFVTVIYGDPPNKKRREPMQEVKQLGALEKERECRSSGGEHYCRGVGVSSSLNERRGRGWA